MHKNELIQKTVIILPTYNEAGNIEKFIREIFDNVFGGGVYFCFSC